MNQKNSRIFWDSQDLETTHPDYIFTYPFNKYLLNSYSEWPGLYAEDTVTNKRDKVHALIAQILWWKDTIKNKYLIKLMWLSPIKENKVGLMDEER